MTIRVKILFFLLSFIINLSFAQTEHTINLKTRTERLPFGLTEEVPLLNPRIGLALSGGGARGLSQIGVLRALEEAGIQVDLIAGTSIGSIVGGFYSSGYSITELDSIAINTDWADLLSIGGTTSRTELFIDQKVTEDRAIFTLRLDGLKPILPTSFNEGVKFSNYLTLQTLMAPLHAKNSFDDLLIKFRAVCTNLVSGEPVILGSGSLGRAMRASSSVTFFLSPVKRDDLTLVDGGLVENIPVKTVKGMGADIVIAVNTTSPLHNLNDLDVPWLIVDQTVSIPMKQLDKKMLSEADIVIEPNMENSLATNFINIDSLIIKGYKSALPHIPTIKAKIDSFTFRQINSKSFYIRNIVCYRDTSQLINSFYKKYSSVDSVSNSTILLDLLTLYKTGLFENIQANIIQHKDSTHLKFVYVPAAVIKSVSIVSGNGVEKSIVDSILNQLNGQIYKPREMVYSVIEVLKHYRKNGYLIAKCSGVEFDKNTGYLQVFFNDGIISKVIIDANTSETVIEREFPVKAGDHFSYDVVKAGLTGLRSTGLFNDINLSITETEEGNILKLSLEERVSSLLKVGFLVNNTYKAQLGLDLRDVNFFGDGTELGLFLFGGASNRAYILEHIAYRVFNTYLTYKINAYYKFNDIGVYERTPSETEKTFTSTKTGEYRQIFYGASLSLGTQIEKFGKLIFTGKYQIDRVKNIEGSVVDPYETKIVSLKIGATIDSRNKFPYPDDGVYFDGYYETAQSFLGGDEGYTLVGMDFRYLFKLNKSQVLTSRIHIGFGDKTLPLSEQFTLGGQHSFFGEYEDEFRGRQIALASLMYQLKLPFKIFFDTYLWFRYDLGATWRTQELIRFKDLKHGIGGTVSFDTPIGPADFSVGRSFLLRKDLPENPLSWGDILFYFSIGHPITF